MSEQEMPYRDYSHIVMERSDGILEMHLHTDGGPLVFSQSAHLELTDAFAALAADYENRAVILTGTGEAFCERLDYAFFENPTTTPLAWSSIEREDAGRIRSMLDIPCPVIAAINGPARVHAEIAVLSDIVLASDTAVLQDGAHFLKGIVPGDGVHLIWPLLLGVNRGRYFLLTGQELNAPEALEGHGSIELGNWRMEAEQ